MDKFKKRILKEFEDMERHMGRMMRNLSIPRMSPLQSGSWLLACDVYETDKELIICMDVMGIDPEKLSVIVADDTVTVSGERTFPVADNISCIHQLEIERGHFERSIQIPVPINQAEVISECRNGFLLLRIKKMKRETGKVKIQVE